MKILSIRTDKPEAEIGLYDDALELSYLKWQAERELSKTILLRLSKELAKQKLELKEIEGLVIYKGPGSFTGLRIGFSVANALAYGLDIAIVSESKPDWVMRGINRLKRGDNEKIAVPEYGAAPHITKPKK